MTGWALVRAAQDGDRDAFAEFYRRYRPIVAGYLRPRGVARTRRGPDQRGVPARLAPPRHRHRATRRPGRVAVHHRPNEALDLVKSAHHRRVQTGGRDSRTPTGRHQRRPACPQRGRPWRWRRSSAPTRPPRPPMARRPEPAAPARLAAFLAGRSHAEEAARTGINPGAIPRPDASAPSARPAPPSPARRPPDTRASRRRMTNHPAKELLRAALVPASRGWPVFPFRPGGKRPALHGRRDAPAPASAPAHIARGRTAPPPTLSGLMPRGGPRVQRRDADRPGRAGGGPLDTPDRGSRAAGMARRDIAYGAGVLAGLAERPSAGRRGDAGHLHRGHPVRRPAPLLRPTAGTELRNTTGTGQRARAGWSTPARTAATSWPPARSPRPAPTGCSTIGRRCRCRAGCSRASPTPPASGPTGRITHRCRALVPVPACGEQG